VQALRFHRSLVAGIAPVLVAAACGGSTASVGGDGGTGSGSDAASSTDGGGTDARSVADSGSSSDGAACVTIDPATYDRSCAGDSDCTMISGGVLCTGGCGCDFTTINKNGMDRYAAATADVKLLACPCRAAGQPRCIEHTCTVCTFGPGAPPGCPDGG
jgi:hypothetical protein